MRLILIASLALLSACPSMSDMQQSLSDLTTSSLVGTWAGEFHCMNRNDQQQALLSFKQSDLPLIAQGQIYSKATNGNTVEYLAAQIEGEMSLTATANITEKAWIVKPSSRWSLTPWHGNRTSPTTIRMKTCGTELVLTRVSHEFITELRPNSCSSSTDICFRPRALASNPAIHARPWHYVARNATKSAQAKPGSA